MFSLCNPNNCKFPTVYASTTSLPECTNSSCKAFSCSGFSNTTSGTKHPALTNPLLSNSNKYPSAITMVSPAARRSRKPE